MNPILRERFTGDVRDRAAQLFGADPEDLVDLGGFENFVFEHTTEDDEDVILRIAHSARRTEAATLGEIDWLRRLANEGASVSAPLPSARGAWVERIDDGLGGYFVATSFQRAPGEVLADRPALRKAHWNAALFREWGRVVAELHSCSSRHRVDDGTRAHWHEYDVVDAARFVPPGEAGVIARARALVGRLRDYPVDPAEYGLIHADITERNFCFQDGKITVFDFDNCEHAWFVKDVAVSLYYVIYPFAANERAGVAGAFLTELLAGYRSVRPLPPSALAMIPDLLSLQRVMNYALFHQYTDKATLTEEQRSYWDTTREAIERGAPIVNVDFERL